MQPNRPSKQSTQQPFRQLPGPNRPPQPPRGQPQPHDAPQRDQSRPKFLLVKHFPPQFTEADVRAVFIDAKSITKVYLCPNSRNVYLKFSDQWELRRIVDDNLAHPLVVNGVKVRMSVVSKLPLDLNTESRVVIVTLYYEKIGIDAFSIYDFLRPFGEVNRIAIYKKKSYQALVEFADEEDARDFVARADNKHHPHFFTRVQFTQKEELVINANTRMEYDFVRAREEDLSRSRGLPRQAEHWGREEPKHFEKKSWEEHVGHERAGREAPREAVHRPAPRQFALAKSTQVLPTQPLKTDPRFDRRRQASYTSFHEEEGYADEGPDSRSNVQSFSGSQGSGALDRQRGADRAREDQVCDDDDRPTSIRRPLPKKQERWLSDDSSGGSGGHGVRRGSGQGSRRGSKRPVAPHTTPVQQRTQPVNALLISNLPAEMGQKQVFNLFSLYGNITSIMHNAQRGQAFVFYRTQLDQVTAFDHLNDTEVFGRQLDIQLEHRWIDAFDDPAYETTPYKLTEQFSAANYAERSRSIIRPNATLYVFNLTPQVTLALIQELFQELRPVLQIEYLNQSMNSCLVYFETKEAAASCLALFKNINMLEKGLKINFANEERAAQRMKSPVKRRREALASVSSFGEPRRLERPTRSEVDEDVDWMGEERDVVVVQVKTQAGNAKRRISHLSTASGDKLG